MAEGVACRQQLLHHTLDPGRAPLQQSLPALVVKGSSKVSEAAGAPAPETELKIAWQYRRYPGQCPTCSVCIYAKSKFFEFYWRFFIVRCAWSME